MSCMLIKYAIKALLFDCLMIAAVNHFEQCEEGAQQNGIFGCLNIFITNKKCLEVYFLLIFFTHIYMAQLSVARLYYFAQPKETYTQCNTGKVTLCIVHTVKN